MDSVDKPPTLQAIFSEQIKMPNSEVSLKCLAFGQPLPTITWKLDGAILIGTHRVRIGSFVNANGTATLSYLNITSIRIEVLLTGTC